MRTATAVSVVIPAHQAADTLAETLESLLAQTFRGWEAVVVDDGSTDGTGALAARFASRDARIRVRRRERGGEAAARNTGLAEGRSEWVLFLDADDWLLPTAIERLAGAGKDRSLDAVHCAWVRVAPDGDTGEELCDATGDLFALFARHCAFPIHACLVRRAVLPSPAFDESLVTCADWDAWQRVARAGARFGAVRDALVRYRMHPASASNRALQLHRDGLEVIARGHGKDTRVQDPWPKHADGAPGQGLSSARLGFTAWTAGLLLGRGLDPGPLLARVAGDRDPGLSPLEVAQDLFTTVPRGLSRSHAVWDEAWSDLEGPIDRFLEALESQAEAPFLARRARLALERLVLSRAGNGLARGRYTEAATLEVKAPFPDLAPPPAAERVCGAVLLQGERLGTIHLPVCGDAVPRWLLADAVAAELAWPILGAFFRQGLYPRLERRREGDAWSIWRGEVRLASGVRDEPDTPHRLHDLVGWTVFLQELWGQPTLAADQLHDPDGRLEDGALEDGPPPVTEGPWLSVEASGPLRDVRTSARELDVELRVGGIPAASLTIPARGGVLRAQRIRASFASALGLELVRVAVREGLLGGPWEEGDTLRRRLAAAAASVPDSEPVGVESHADVAFAPGWGAAAVRALPAGAGGLVLAPRAEAAIGTSASRRALLPAATAPELLAALRGSGQPWLELVGGHPTRISHAPDLQWRPLAGAARRGASRRTESPSPLARLIERARRFSAAASPRRSGYDRHHFESLFAQGRDPWSYETPFEQRKYEQTLALIPPGRIGRALELACAEGHFTARLASRADHLVAADVSLVALERAAARCAGRGDVSFERLDLFRDPLPRGFDLVVCSEVLYYAGRREALRAVGRKLARALRPGGHLLLTHTNLQKEEPRGVGLDWAVPFGARVIGETVGAIPSLRFLRELRTPLYRVQLFRREGRRLLGRPARGPVVVEEGEHFPPSRHVAERFRRGGDAARDTPLPPPSTAKLPILMYHRVAPEGAWATARYRVTPERFAEQLLYLRETGFYAVRLEDWRRACAARRPLPGRAILLTFDDAYLDFETWAWPLLKRQGWTAVLSVVADRVGDQNRWDAAYGETVPLLGWESLRRLHDGGVTIASHGATHRPLTALTPAAIVDEAARSRAVLEAGLGAPVTAFAYPHGDADAVVEHLVGASGYAFGLSCRPGPSGLHEPLLSLRRIEVSGFDGMESFIAKLG